MITTITLTAWLTATSVLASAEPLPGLEPSSPIPDDESRVVVIGDSITQAGDYVVYVEAFLLTRFPDRTITIINHGLSSETAAGTSEADHPGRRPWIHDRFDRDVTAWNPDIVVACYGMNDGIYHPLDPERFRKYQDGITRLIHRSRSEAFARIDLLTPPPYDPYRRQVSDPQASVYGYRFPVVNYDQVLAHYAEWLRSLASEHQLVVDVNQALLNLLGHQRTQLINAPLDILLNNKDGTLSDLNAFQQQDKQDVTHFETNLRSATGQTISCNIEAMRLDNQVSQTVMLAVKDISQQKRQAALIETLSHHDTLSGLLNRPSTTKALNQALTDKRAIITLYVIATRLREIYEIYGHHAYDNAVKHIADMLKQQFPQAEIGRLSENEFIVFTDQIAADQFAPRANTVLKVSANHLSETTADFDIGLNAAMIGPELAFTHFEPLVHCGFYAIEQQSVPKHNVTIVDQETVQAANETLTINRNLVTALKNDEFTAFFQPIVNATSNQVIGFEALARWYHP